MPRQVTPNNQGQTPGYSFVRPVLYGGTGQNNPVDATKTLGFIGNSEINVPNGAVQLGVDGRIPSNFFPSSLLNQQNPVITGPLSLTYGQVATYTITNYNATDTYTVTTVSGSATISGATITYTAPNTTGAYGFIVNGVTTHINVSQEIITVVGPNTLNENQTATYTISNYNASTPYTINIIQGSYTISGATITYTAPAGNGVNTINAGFIINGTTIHVVINPPPSPLVTGPTSLALNQIAVYTITNYQAGSTYNISALSGTIAVSGATITYTAPNTTGVFGFIVNGTTVAVNVVLPTIQTPTIQSPVNSATNLNSSVTVTATAFSMTSGTDTQTASNWQLAADPGFTTLVQQSLSDTTNLTTWTINNLTANSTYYIRVQYIGSKNEYSQYSTAVGFSTKSVFAPSAITASITLAGSPGYGLIDINGTGDIVVVGATNGTNSAYIYTKSLGVWTQTAVLVGTAISNYYTNATAVVAGIEVCINGVGDVVVIAQNSFGYNGYSNVGAACVFVNVSGTWTQTQTFSGYNINNFGTSVAISGNSNVIVIGAAGYSTGNGSLHIYEASTSFSDPSATIATTQGIADTNFGGSYTVNFGANVSISTTGDVIAAGSSDNANNTGIVYIFTKNTSGPWSLTTGLYGSEATANSFFGNTVSINGTGNTVVVGSVNRSTNPGQLQIYVFANISGTWTQQAILTDALYSSVGPFQNIALNKTGNIAIINLSGLYNGSSSNLPVLVFTNINGTWSETAQIYATGYLAIDSAGDTAIIKQNSSIDIVQ